MKSIRKFKIFYVFIFLALFFFSFVSNVYAESGAIIIDLDEIVDNNSIDYYLDTEDLILEVKSLKNVNRLKDFKNIRYLVVKNVKIEDASFLNFPTTKIPGLHISNSVINFEKLDINKYDEISITKCFYLGGDYSKLPYVSEKSFINPEYNMTENYTKELDDIAKSIYKYGMTDEEIIRAVTEYIVDKMEYKDECPDSFEKNYLNGCGVCEHYAHFTSELLNRLGVYTITVYGYGGNESHAWNLVLLNNKWYYVDNTWIDTSKSSRFAAYNSYYLASPFENNLFNATHRVEMDYSMIPTNLKSKVSILEQIKEELKPKPTPSQAPTPSATPIPSPKPTATPKPSPTPTPYTKKEEPKDDAVLKLLSVAGKEIELARGVYEYKLTVGKTVEDLKLIYAPLEGTSEVTIMGNEKLKEGQNVIYIKVKSITGNSNIYTLIINKSNTSLSSNSKIKELKIEGVNINFDKDSTIYKIKIGKNVNTLKFNIKLDDRKAKYEIIGNEELENNDKILVRVTAEDNTETTYSIFVEKDESNTILFIVLLIVIITTSEISVVFIFKFIKKLVNKK